MCKFNRRILLAVLLSFVAGFSLAVWAGPVLPGTQKLPGEIQSLIGLSQFRTDIGRLLAMPSQVPATRQFVLEEMQKRLTDSGMQLGEDEDRDLPLITIDLVFGTDPEQPQALGVTGVLSLYQKVTIDRLDQKLMLPTSTIVLSQITTMDNAKETMNLVIRSTTGAFADSLKLANAGRDRPPANDSID